MSDKWLTWDLENGTINLVRDKEEERVILMRKGFMDAFFEEIEMVEGPDALSVTFRTILKKFGLSERFKDKPELGLFNKLRDNHILPISIEKCNLPEVLKWDGKTRELIVFGDTPFTIEPLEFVHEFKEAMVDVFTDKGAVAILNRVSKRGGFAVGERACANYGWVELDSAMVSMDEALSFSFPYLGWGKTRVVTRKDKDGYYMFYLKCWNAYESHNVTASKPQCTIFQRYLEGIGESIALNLASNACDSREVKCTARGDDYCAFAIKQKNMKSHIIDWNRLEGEWRELDEMELNA